MRWFKKAIFGASILSTHQTLKQNTWHELFLASPGLLPVRNNQRKARTRRRRNSYQGAFLQIAILFIGITALAKVPRFIIDTYVPFLKWFDFNQADQAYATISEVMGSTATIIGLSFVVIGFLIDVVKDKTQRTLEEMFRATYLYHVFGIAVISIIILVIFNFYKYSVSIDVLCNMAVISSLFLIIDACSIAFLFYKLLAYFNPERIAEVERQHMLDLARFQLLDDRYNHASTAVYSARMEKLGLEEKSELAFFLIDAPNYDWINLRNDRDVTLIDVHFPILTFLIRRILKRSNETGFTSLRSGATIRANQGIIFKSIGVELNKWERILLNFAFLTTRESTTIEDYEAIKKRLEKRLLKATLDGDPELIEQTLDEITKLYDIFYEINA